LSGTQIISTKIARAGLIFAKPSYAFETLLDAVIKGLSANAFLAGSAKLDGQKLWFFEPVNSEF